MLELRQILESVGLDAVETFIASGNVIFTAKRGNADALERKIEKSFRDALGYDVETFLRTGAEIRAVTEAVPFPAGKLDRAMAFNVAFTRAALSHDQQSILSQFNTGIDEFAALGREIYWICTSKQSESRFASARLERLLGSRVTWRNINTVRRLSAKYPPA